MADHRLLHSDSSDQRLRHLAGKTYCSCIDWRGFSDILFDVPGGLALIPDGLLYAILRYLVESKYPLGIVVAI